MGLGASVCPAGPGAGPSAAAAVRPGVDGGGGVPGRAFGVLASFVVVNEHVREVIEEGRKLPVRLKLNLRYVAASVQAAQASFFGVLVFAGFVFLGLVSVPEATIATWTGKPPAMVELGPLDIPGAPRSRRRMCLATPTGEPSPGSRARLGDDPSWPAPPPPPPT